MNKDQLKQLEANLWRAADSLRANSDLNASEYAAPVLGLIFLKFADNKYRQFEAAILAEYHKRQGNRYEKKLSDIAIEQCGIYLSDHARSAQHNGLAQHLLKIFSYIPLDAGDDLFGNIYKYFLANFAMSEGQSGGEFFTPRRARPTTAFTSTCVSACKPWVCARLCGRSRWATQLRVRLTDQVNVCRRIHNES